MPRAHGHALRGNFNAGPHALQAIHYEVFAFGHALTNHAQAIDEGSELHGADNKVQYRAVKLGPLVDGLRVIREGVTKGEYIVVNGLQRVRPGVEVAPQRVAMGPRHPVEGVLAYNPAQQ